MKRNLSWLLRGVYIVQGRHLLGELHVCMWSPKLLWQCKWDNMHVHIYFVFAIALYLPLIFLIPSFTSWYLVLERDVSFASITYIELLPTLLWKHYLWYAIICLVLERDVSFASFTYIELLPTLLWKHYLWYAIIWFITLIILIVTHLIILPR